MKRLASVFAALVLGALMFAPASPSGVTETSNQTHMSSNGTTLTCALASAPAVGDLLVSVMGWNSNATATVPSGWTVLGSQLNSSLFETIEVIYRYATSADVSSYSYNTTLSASSGGQCMTYDFTGENATTPFVGNLFATQNGVTSASISSAPTGSPSYPIAVFYTRSTPTAPTPGTGWAQDQFYGGLQTQNGGQVTGTSSVTATAAYGTSSTLAEAIFFVNPAVSVALQNNLAIGHAGGPHETIALAVNTPAPTPPATITQTHIQVIEGGGTSVEPSPPATPLPYSLASPGPWAKYVSFVFSPLYSYAAAYKAAGIPRIFYDDPMMPFDGTTGGATPGPCSAQTSSVYDCQQLRTGGTYNSVNARDSSNNMVTSYAGKGLVADPTTSQFRNYWYADLTNWCSYTSGYGSNYTNGEIFIDNNSGGGMSATPPDFSYSAWGTGFSNAATALGTLPGCFSGSHIITNTFGLSDASQSTLINNYMQSSVIDGGEYEECFTAPSGGYGWYAVADSGILAIAYLKANNHAPDSVGWECYANNQTLPASSNWRARLYVYASYLMVYDLHYSSLMESFGTAPSNITVLPETQFVPLGPSLTASDPIISSPLCASTCTTSGYSVTNGVFVQYFTNGCYYQGTKVADSCEVAVNPTGTTDWTSGAVSGGVAQSIPNPNNYAHQLICTGADIPDGGTCDFTAASSNTLQPQSGEILVP